MENKLVRLSLKGFKSINDIQLDLKNLNVLIGANGSGKSNLIAFFRMLSAMMSGKLQFYVGEQGGASKFLHDGPKRTPDMEATLAIQADSDFGEYNFRLSYASDDALVFAEEKYRLGASDFVSPVLTPVQDSAHFFSGNRETQILSSLSNSSKITKAVRQIFGDFVVYHFQDTSKEARIKTRWHVADNAHLKHDAANLAPFLLNLLENFPKYYERIVSHIQLVAPFFDDFVLEPEFGTLLLQWRERGSDVIFGASQASDGTLRTMALITALLQPPEKLPALVIIDEPELGLHPSAISMIGGLINATALHRQVLIATQSPWLLDQFEPNDVLVAERDDRSSTYSRLEEEPLREWLAEYSLSDLWNRNILGGRP